MNAFFIFIVGIKPIVKEGRGIQTAFCPHCRAERTFRAVDWRNYLTLFFIPLFPVGRRHEGIACPSCGLIIDRADAPPDVDIKTARVHAADPAAETLVVQCPRCDGRMRVPLRERGFTAVCPHCAMQFKVKGRREPVPGAEILDD